MYKYYDKTFVEFIFYSFFILNAKKFDQMILFI